MKLFKRKKKEPKPLPAPLPKDGAEQPDKSVWYHRWPDEGRRFQWEEPPKTYER